MAEEPKKEKRSDKRYGKSPKIEEKAKKTPGEGVEVEKAKPQTVAGDKPKSDVGTGTEGVTVVEQKTEQPKAEEARPVDGAGAAGRHAMERHDMHVRHRSELDDMHMRHEREHAMHGG